jgi:voltage-gated potassium channel
MAPMKNPKKALRGWAGASDNFMLILSLVWIGLLILPIAHPISKHAESSLKIANYIIWAIFAFDFVWKLVLSKKKRKYVNTHIPELLMVLLPFFRPLRLLRLIPAVAYFLKSARESLAGRLTQYVALSAVLVTVPSAILVFDSERRAPGSNIKTLGDALWWAATTVTTVGYGDRYPVTTTRRILAVLVMLMGISLVGVITASVASWFVKSDENRDDKIQMKQLLDELQEIKKLLVTE